MGVKWTEEQEKVIRLRNRNILVSAAAGSGKTAVLVERIITMLTKDDPPMDVDRLLIVTFTEAAASEMKERIRLAIEKKLMEYPDNEHLKQQATLIHNAQITTIHSFCLSVIRDHFHAIDIDPGFRIGEEGELKLLRHDVLEDMLEEKYQEGSKRFLDFTAAYSTGRNDKKIEDLILKIYEFSRSYPDSEAWLDSCVKAYEIPDVKALEGSSIMKKVMTDIRKNLEDAKELLIYAENVALSPEGPAVYEATLEKDLQVIEELCNRASYKSLAEAFSNVKWARIAANKDKTVSEEKIDLVKKIREMVKGIVKNMSAQYFYESPEELVEDLRVCAPAMEELADLVRLFAERFEEQKRAQNMIDFSDMEQYALRILTQKTENGFVPSKIAEEYQKQFEEIMIDEYQDSNLIQEAILTSVSGCRSGRYNIFMVGDVKQSIYRFRLSRPELFLEKFRTYNIEESKTQRIDLHKNFRSRKEVLESANAIFRQIMTEKLGGIVYDDQAALYPGMAFPEAKGKNIADNTELLFLKGDGETTEPDDESLDSVELEAKLAAVRIREMTDPEHGMDIYDGALGDYRKAGYKDIVILLRTVTGWAEKFVDVLASENIPSTAEMSAGFFDTLEIRTMLQFLAIVDNPGQDIPLAAVLCSPIVGISSEEMALIRSKHSEGSLFGACMACSEETPGAAKLKKFLAMFHDIRRASVYLELHELIRYIYDRTGYYDYVQALPGGERRKANLDLLRERAVAYAAGSYSSLFDFMRYIEQLKKNQIDFGEAVMPENDKGRVRIMSIHKSKGLEYPIVILAGLGKKFNFQDSISKLVMHAKSGIGLDAVNLQTRKKMTSAYKKFIAARLNLETLAEEQRILYVAMTRAKEKLIMTGMESLKNTDKKLEIWQRNSEILGEVFPDWMLTSARSYLDWIMPAVMNGEAENVVTLRMVDIRALAGREVGRVIDKKWQKEELLQRKHTLSDVSETDVSKRLFGEEGWQYPQKALLSVKGKYSVSELKKYAMEAIMEAAPAPGMTLAEKQSETEEALPDFMKDKEVDETHEVSNVGAFRGTAYHRALELIDFAGRPDERDEAWLRSQLNAMTSAGRLSEEQRQSIRIRDIADMVFSNLGLRMAEADRRHELYREAQFVMGVPVSALYPEVDSEETVLIQGIIDAYFEENGELILLDYKTDHVSKQEGADILKKRYKRQLDDYQQALEQMLQKKVRQKLIYSFALKCWIEI